MCTIRADGNEPNYISWRVIGSTENGEECSGIGTSSMQQTTVTGTAPIYLFNEQPTDNYRYIILREVMIYDENNTLIKMYQPAKINNEIVIVEALSGDILRPNAGTLIEVTE